jgi:serine/threonine-protein kinase
MVDDAEGPDTVETSLRSRADAQDHDDKTQPLEGYMFGKVIGRGGVGEVIAAHDLRIGRDVAIKRLRTATPAPDDVARFMREARIQARLDHPSIPPVHELGRLPDGRPYFAMKRLAGVTLRELLADPKPDRARLLRAFADVCHAIDFAHSRGVVHRDLKPSNIMLGDFGEIYVLDWGLARVVGEAVAELVSDDIESLELKNGDVLGTPGYMAPEQLQTVDDAGRPADIYALGSVLFEILAGEPLHPRGPTAVQSTLGGKAKTSPVQRRADRAIPPELDAICMAMLQMDPMSRPTARRVAERVRAYLDGDRDVARRREIATDLVWGASAALDDGRRAEAMRAAGRALALDPESSDAGQLVTRLMLEPPTEPPPELASALRDTDADLVRRHAPTATAAYLAIAGCLPFEIWNGVRRWDVVVALFIVACAMASYAWGFVRRPQPTLAQMIAYAVGNALLVALISRLAGPFTFAPTIVCVIAMSVMAYPHFTQRSSLLLAILAAGYLLPVALELAGTLSSTFEIRGGELISHAGALIVNQRTVLILIGASVALIVFASVDAARIYRANRQARLQLAIQAWHLRQLLPAAARPTPVPTHP